MYASFAQISYHPLSYCVSICGTMTATIPFVMQPWGIRPARTARLCSGKHGSSSVTYHDTHARCLMQHCNRHAGAQCHDPDLQEAVRAGQLIELLLNPQHPEVRLRLTLSRCMCGLGQSRVADLTRHLQTQHGPFYRAADEYVALIEEQHLDCVCNPRRPAQPRAHRCIAWRQLATIEFFINPDRRQFFPTWPITADSLVKLALIFCSSCLGACYASSSLGLPVQFWECQPNMAHGTLPAKVHPCALSY